jgi:ABC-type Fe3+-hydroxamate transport system substrate-binding protein
VFVSTASQLESFSKTLDEQGIAVFVTNPSNLDAVLKNLTQLGELFGTVDSASRKVKELSERLKEISGLVELDKHFRMEIGESAPRVFIQISNEPLFTIGKESFLTELIQQAGGESVTKDVPTAYPKLSKETAAALDPDVIILSDSEDNREPSGVLKGSKAVKNGRVYRINADIISRPGPRLVDALEEISAKLGEKK